MFAYSNKLEKQNHCLIQLKLLVTVTQTFFPVAVRARSKKIKISNLYVSLLSNSNTCSCAKKKKNRFESLTGDRSCPVGRVTLNRRAGMSSNARECLQPIVMNFATPVKKAFLTWRAPACKDASLIFKYTFLYYIFTHTIYSYTVAMNSNPSNEQQH